MLKAAHEPGISAKIVVLPGASYRLLDVGLPLRPVEQFVRGKNGGHASCSTPAAATCSVFAFGPWAGPGVAGGSSARNEPLSVPGMMRQ